VATSYRELTPTEAEELSGLGISGIEYSQPDSRMWYYLDLNWPIIPGKWFFTMTRYKYRIKVEDEDDK